MNRCFSQCHQLKRTPEFPESVTSLEYAFAYCFALTQASTIPGSVTNMDGTFVACSALTGSIVINATPASYLSCFASTTQPIVLNGSSTVLNELAATGNNGNVTVGE
jgi:hypothetical protein